MLVAVTDALRAARPGALIGALRIRVAGGVAGSLEEAGKEVEAGLRRDYGALDREALLRLPVFAAYAAYYRSFKKTYHVLLQTESVAKAGKSIPNSSSLVAAMFMAELKNGLLTAGHDAGRIVGPLRADIAGEGLVYEAMSGREQTAAPGDMYVADDSGVLSSIIYGPDRRTRLRPKTSEAVYVVYAPAGIAGAAVESHLADIAAYVGLAAPDAEVVESGVYG